MQNPILIREKFSRASGEYDEHALLQMQIADELCDRLIPLDSIQRVLDIGMGTGYLLDKLKKKYPGLIIYGLDLAWGMLEKSKNRLPMANLTQADAKHLPFSSETFEMAISNLTYQWVSDLEPAFEEARRALSRKGKFYFTIFSQNTLSELRESIFGVLNTNGSVNLSPVANLPDKYAIENLLKKSGFKNIEIDLKIFRCFYSDLLELLNWLKIIGANKYWLNNFYNGLSARCFINDIIKYYEQKFSDSGKIFATFEVLFVEANK